MSARRSSLKATTESEIAEQQSQISSVTEVQKIVDVNHVSDDLGIDSYLDTPDVDKAEIEDTRNELNELKIKYLDLQEENSRLLDTIKKMENEKKDIDADVSNAMIEKLQSENDDLILRNSDLELEIHKYTETVKYLKEKINNMENTYSRPSDNPMHTVKGNGLRTNQNGYQEWR